MHSMGIIRQSIQLSWENIKSNKMRTFLTTLGIIIGVTAVISLITIVNGVIATVMNEFASLGAGTISVSISGTPLKRGLTESDLESLEVLDNVAGVSPTISSTGMAARNQKLLDSVSIQGKNCMVIGNGEMGKVTALALKEAGAEVTVTVRQYRSGIVTIPQGCDRINYGERLDFLPKCDLVVSATASPNYTLTMEQIENAEIPGHVVLIDLAVPRDIEPSAGTLNNVTLYDIDSFKIDAVSPKLQASLDQAGEILREQQEEFYNWYNGRDLIPRIQEIKADAVEDLNLRIMKILRKTPMEEKDRENLLKAIDTAAGKVVNKMMFGLKDFMKEEEFINCVEGLEKLYEE